MILVFLCGAAAPARAADPEALGFELTPPRLAAVDGEVSFFRPGAQGWSAAQVNTPLAAGDELYAADGSDLELQVGSRGYLRAAERTQVGLTSLEPDYLQFRVNAGQVSLDLRARTAGQTFEVDTPNAAFTIERSGYYRIEVADDTTTLTSRRGGRADVTPAGGQTVTVAPSEQVVITGSEAPRLETYAAPDLDAWDRWNYARTDSQVDAVSARYVPAGIYGAQDLDDYGDWRLVPTYGAVWIPRGLPVGWAPYTTGNWLYDPYYGWTWVDAAPWGWAPYHYGRWVYVSGYWGWAPGPMVIRPYYAPALVAFFSNGGVSMGISFGPDVGWIALGWGEPIVPWWGPSGFRGVPRWAGWGGPRIANRVTISHNVVVHARDLRQYENQRVRGAFVAVNRDRFGRHDATPRQLTEHDRTGYHPIDRDLDLRPTRDSLSPSLRASPQPPSDWQKRGVVATRTPRPAAIAGLTNESPGRSATRPAAVPQPRGGSVHVVEPTRASTGGRTYERPPFGTQSEGERATPPPPPRYSRENGPTRRAAPPAQTSPRGEGAARIPPEPPGHASVERQATTSHAQQETHRHEAAPARPQSLPGEPANRVYRGNQRPRQGESERSEESQPRTTGHGGDHDGHREDARR